MLDLCYRTALRYTVPAMQFDLITIFPEFFTGPLDYGIVRRARETRLVDVRVHDLRAFTHDRHRTVDDRPFGGGEGMVLKPEPLFEAVESLLGARNSGQRKRSGAQPAPPIVLLSASGKLIPPGDARRFAALDRIILLCGRYEGVDERVAEHLATDELSIGDFVLSGGELAAAMVLDAVTRLIPGALGNEDSSVNESFSATEATPSAAGVLRHGSQITSHEVTSFSTSPTTRARPNSAAGRFRKFCWAATTNRFGAGGWKRRWRRRPILAATARICSTSPASFQAAGFGLSTFA